MLIDQSSFSSWVLLELLPEPLRRRRRRRRRRQRRVRVRISSVRAGGSDRARRIHAAVAFEEVDDAAVVGLEGPGGGLEGAAGGGAVAGEADDAGGAGAADGEADVDAAAQLVDLAGDPGDGAAEVDLVAEVLARARRRPQRVQRRRHHRRRQLLVVEDRRARRRDRKPEQRQRPHPPGALDVCWGRSWSVFMYACVCVCVCVCVCRVGRVREEKGEGGDVLGSSRSGRLSISGPSPGFGAATVVRPCARVLVGEEMFLAESTALRRIIRDSILVN